ncbi:MAG: M23 family metallopeptidase [Candidatus Methanomethylophilaceae archaeon]|nr:M23 family metallopeptidase [Candidatus Methanomethylophilaceae archaeon]
MILQSQSGYCMPFEEREKEVEMILGYGKQTNPETGKEFFHHGVDFKAPRYLLSAIASGTVSGIGNDPVHGAYQIIRYGDYDVTYSHLSNIFSGFGKEVKAGQVVSVSGDFLHMEARYKGEELNPIEFLTMIYGNIRSMESRNKPFEATDFATIGDGIHTRYDRDSEEIEQLMLRFFPAYMNDLTSGAYALPQRTEQMLRNILTMASARNYFFEMIPSMENPMGLGRRSVPLAEKVQNLLIEDFLSYLALQHGTCLSTWNDEVKKKFTGRQ